MSANNDESSNSQEKVENNCAYDPSNIRSPGTNQDDMILAQQQRIEKEISDTIPLVGAQEELSQLAAEYEKDEVYCKKVKDLSGKYKHIRRTRPDGNCFFRAFAFAYLERLLHDQAAYQRFSSIAQRSKDSLVELGFPQFTIEDFHDTFMEVVGKVGQPITVEELLDIFNHASYSDYIVVFLRLVTSGQLQRDEAFYANFIDGGRTVKDFCHQEVEPMYKESDHIHIIALASALEVGVRVRYMDRGKEGQVVAHDFPEGKHPSLHLLYRPGHYDILYP